MKGPIIIVLIILVIVLIIASTQLNQIDPNINVCKTICQSNNATYLDYIGGNIYQNSICYCKDNTNNKIFTVVM